MKKIFAVLFTFLLSLSIFTSCSRNATEGKLLIFGNYPEVKLLTISPVLPVGTISELPTDEQLPRLRRITSPDGKTLVFVKIIGGQNDGDEINFSLIIYQTQDIFSPITLAIPENIVHRLGTCNFTPVWKGKDMFLKVMSSGERFYELALYRIDIQNRTFELAETVSIDAQANMSGCADCTLPDLSKAVMFPFDQDSIEHFGIYDAETRKLTNFDMIGIADSYPSWAPDGKSLAYMTTVGDNQICLIKVSVNGVDIRSQIVFCPELSALPGEKVVSISSKIDWSPDGKYLALSVSGFFTFDAGGNQYLSQHLYIVRSTGSEVVTFDSDTAFGSTWSPDSKKLVFLTCSSGENPKIYTVDADGTNQNLIYTDSKVCEMSPFGPIDNISIAGWLK